MTSSLPSSCYWLNSLRNIWFKTSVPAPIPYFHLPPHDPFTRSLRLQSRHIERWTTYQISRKRQRSLNGRNRLPQGLVNLFFRRVRLTFRLNPKVDLRTGRARTISALRLERTLQKEHTINSIFFVIFRQSFSLFQLSNCDNGYFNGAIEINEIMVIISSRHLCRVLLEHGHDHSLTLAAFSCKD